MNLLEKVRLLNEVFQAYETVDVQSLADALSDVIKANVYCSDHQGVLLGYKQLPECQDESKFVLLDGKRYYPDIYNRYLRNVIHTDILPAEKQEAPVKNTVIVPIYKGSQRLGTLMVELLSEKLQSDDVVLAEFAGIVLGASLQHIQEESKKRREQVKLAMDTLSFTETRAALCILQSLEGNEGYVVASKIADESQITRSVIVNALRKLESASIIESRSLGMKGTYIKILIPEILESLR